MDNVFAKSLARDSCSRFCRRAYGDVQHSLRVFRHEPRPAASPSFQRNPTPSCGVDGPTGSYSLRPDRPQFPCAFHLPGCFLIRDNDKIYGMKFRTRVDGLGLKQIRTAFRSPWQNGFVERWIGSLRRDCLDHVIAINERQLRRVIRLYVDYYHADRTHLELEKDAPEKRSIEPREIGAVVAIPRVGGLHHRYTRELQRAA